MEAGETAPTDTFWQQEVHPTEVRLATLAPGQTSGAARRNQAREQFLDGASRATHEGMLRNPLATRCGERTEAPRTGRPVRGAFPGNLSSFGSEGEHRDPSTSVRRDRGTAAEERGPRRGNKPMGDTGDTPLETAGCRNGLVSGARPRSRPLPRRVPDPGTWKRVARKGTTNSGAREGNDAPASAGTPRTSRVRDHLDDVGVRFGGSEPCRDPGHGPPAPFPPRWDASPLRPGMSDGGSPRPLRQRPVPRRPASAGRADRSR